MRRLVRWSVQIFAVVLALGCEDPTGVAATGTTPQATTDASSTAHVDYALVIADEADTAEQGGVRLRRGWLTVAGLTAMPCTDVASRAAPSWGDRLHDAILPRAWAGHSASGLPAWQVLGSQVVALHEPANHTYGLATEAPSELCRMHLLLGRAENDAPSLATLPAEVTMARMTLHLELTLPDGDERTVRTDIGWGEVKDAAPGLAAGDGTATVTLRPRAALATTVAELDPSTSTDKDFGRAMLQALCEGASVGFAAE